jgi:two-component system sensor histidine kinase QseC
MIHLITRPSIARRIFIALVFASVATWIAFYSQRTMAITAPESGSYDQLMHLYASVIAEIYETHPEEKELTIALTGLNTLFKVFKDRHRLDAQFINFSVWSKEGVLQTKSQFAPAVRMGDLQQIGFYNVQNGQEIQHAQVISLWNHLAFNKKEPTYRVYVQSLNQGQLYIQMTQSMNSRHDSISASILNYDGAIKPFLIGFPLIFIPLLIAVYTGLKPLRLFSHELAKRQPGDLQILSQPHVYSELAPVIREFNSTLARLQELLQRERDFLADAAHELRTPLALITVQSDALIHSENRVLREEASRRLTAGLERANRLANQLLTLAKIDADDAQMMREIDVADLIRECLAAYFNEAKQSNIKLSYEGPNSYLIQAPSDAIYSIISNLVSNAIRYGNANGRVIVSLSKNADSRMQLQVMDDGPGIELHQQEKMFLRFHRGKDVSASGAGLGLAIVTSAVRLLKAELQVHTGLDGKGVCFTLLLQTE